MKPAARRIYLVVLLGLLVGHTGIAVHAAMHVSGDTGECEFCIAYGHSAGTVATVQAQRIPDSRGSRLADIHPPAPEMRYVTPYHPRDPPLAD